MFINITATVLQNCRETIRITKSACIPDTAVVSIDTKFIIIITFRPCIIRKMCANYNGLPTTKPHYTRAR